MGLNATNQGKWTERFGISSSDLIGLPEKLAEHPDVEALRWCLMNGKISEAEYLEWAMQAYEMPAVTGDFFTATQNEHDFWDSVKDLYPWDPGFFPLAEWEGVFLIACLEPPTDFKFDYPYRFVLASARHLLLLWDHLNPASVPAPMEETGPQTVAPLNMNVPVNARGSDTFDMPDGIVMNGTFGRSAPEETTPNTNFGADEAPTGLTFDTSDVAPRPKVPDGFVAAQEEMIPPLSHQPDGLMAESIGIDGEETAAGQDDDDAKTMVVASAQPAPARAAVATQPPQPPQPPQAPQAPQAPTPPPARQEPVIPARPAAAAPPPAPPVVEERPAPPPPAEPIAVARTSAPEPEPAKPAASNDSDGGTLTNFTITTGTPRPLSSAPDMTGLGTLGLSHMHQQFELAMILLFDDASQTLKPWKWSDMLTSPANSQLPSIDLNQPSAFRIVYRSKQPFHGQVYTSGVNQTFANAFLGGKLPSCMTVVPVMDGRQWKGMLLGITTKPRPFRQVIGPFQDVSDEFAKALARLNKANAA